MSQISRAMMVSIISFLAFLPSASRCFSVLPPATKSLLMTPMGRQQARNKQHTRNGVVSWKKMRWSGGDGVFKSDDTRVGNLQASPWGEPEERYWEETPPDVLTSDIPLKFRLIHSSKGDRAWRPLYNESHMASEVFQRPYFYGADLKLVNATSKQREEVLGNMTVKEVYEKYGRIFQEGDSEVCLQYLGQLIGAYYPILVSFYFEDIMTVEELLNERRYIFLH